MNRSLRKTREVDWWLEWRGDGEGKAAVVELLLTICFNQPVRLHGICLCGSADCGPDTVRLLVNTPDIDFPEA